MNDPRLAAVRLRRDYVLDRERHAVVRRPQPDEPPAVPRLPPQPVGWSKRVAVAMALAFVVAAGLMAALGVLG